MRWPIRFQVFEKSDDFQWNSTTGLCNTNPWHYMKQGGIYTLKLTDYPGSDTGSIIYEPREFISNIWISDIKTLPKSRPLPLINMIAK